MSSLIAKYKSLDKVELSQILDFHVKFERIRPYEDCNGRVGRLIMLKECLRHCVDPFVIDDKRRGAYNRGIDDWKQDRTP